jgi:hypothetical protein
MQRGNEFNVSRLMISDGPWPLLAKYEITDK